MDQNKLLSIDTIKILLFFALASILLMPINNSLILLLVFVNLFTVILSFFMYNEKINRMMFSKTAITFFLTYFCYAMITVLWAFNKTLFTRQIAYILIHEIVFWVTYYYISKGKKILDVFIKFLVLVGISYVMVSTWEMLNFTHLPTSKHAGTKFPVPTGFFFGENNQALSISLMLPFISYLYVITKKVIPKLMLLALILALFGITVVAGARLSLIALIPLLLYILFFKTPKKQLICEIALFLSIAFYYIRRFPDQYMLFKEFLALQFTSITSEASSIVLKSTQIRKNMIMKGVELFDSSNFKGVGAGNFEHYAGNGVYFQLGWIENPHSYFFELLANYGFIIPVAFLIFWLALTYNSYRIARNTSGNTRELAYFCTAFLIIFVPVSFLPSSMFDMYLVWMLFGLVMGFQYLHREYI